MIFSISGLWPRAWHQYVWGNHWFALILGVVGESEMWGCVAMSSYASFSGRGWVERLRGDAEQLLQGAGCDYVVFLLAELVAEFNSSKFFMANIDHGIFVLSRRGCVMVCAVVQGLRLAYAFDKRRLDAYL
jgi:hypothetical protein